MPIKRLELVAHPYMHPNWKDSLQKLGFEGGDLQGAKFLMEEVSRGIEFVRNQFQYTSKPLISPPSLYFTSGSDQSDQEPAPAQYNDHFNSIYIDIDQLRRAVNLGTLELVIEKDTQTNTVLFRGMVADKYYLSGAHETDHARYFQHHQALPQQDRLHPADISTAQYDAQPHELSALNTELLAAEVGEFLEQTTQVLRARIDAATQHAPKNEEPVSKAQPQPRPISKKDMALSWFRYARFNWMGPRGGSNAEKRHHNRIDFLESFNQEQLESLLAYSKQYEQYLQQKKLGHLKFYGPKVHRAQNVIRILQKMIEHRFSISAK